MSTTPRLVLPEIAEGQSQKYLTHNEALMYLDAIVQGSVIDKDLTAPPGSPTAGDAYIPAATATGDWTGLENQIVFYRGGVWNEITPLDGFRVWVADEGRYYVYRGSAWSKQQRMLWVPAREMSPSASGGCAPLATIATSANRPDVQSLDFDTSTVEYAQFSRVMPYNWNLGTLTFMALWSHAATTVNFGAAFSLQAVSVADDETIDVAYGTAVPVVDTGGTTNDLYVSPVSAAVTVAGTPALGEEVHFRIARETADAGDTMAIDARLMGIVLFYESIDD